MRRPACDDNPFFVADGGREAGRHGGPASFGQRHFVQFIVFEQFLGELHNARSGINPDDPVLEAFTVGFNLFNRFQRNIIGYGQTQTSPVGNCTEHIDFVLELGKEIAVRHGQPSRHGNIGVARGQCPPHDGIADRDSLNRISEPVFQYSFRKVCRGGGAIPFHIDNFQMFFLSGVPRYG